MRPTTWLRGLAPFVPMVQSTHARQGDELRRPWGTWRDRCLVRRVFVETQVAAVFVVVADVPAHEPDQMPFAEDDDVFE